MLFRSDLNKVVIADPMLLPSHTYTFVPRELLFEVFAPKDVKKALEECGVVFPPGTNITYDAGKGTVTVTHFSPDLERIEELIPILDKMHSETTEENMIRRLGGKDIVATIRATDSIEACRVKVDEDDDINKDWLRWKTIEISGFSKLPPGQVRDAKSIITEPKSYLSGMDKCVFDPGVKLILHSDDRPLEILICYHCNDLCVVDDGKPVGYANFRPGRAKLVEFAKKIFPSDKEIQSLSSKE